MSDTPANFSSLILYQTEDGQTRMHLEVSKHSKKGELEALCSLDFHFKEVNSRFKKLGLG